MAELAANDHHGFVLEELNRVDKFRRSELGHSRDSLHFENQKQSRRDTVQVDFRAAEHEV